VFASLGSLPKVLYVPSAAEEGDDAKAAKEPPSWLTTAAMGFKEGRSYSAKFAFVPPKDALRVAQRFGLASDALPALLGCRVAEGGTGGTAHLLKAEEHRVGGGAAVRAVKSFVKELVAESVDAESALPLPSFPEPTRPRKQASASLEEFTHESLPVRQRDAARSPIPSAHRPSAPHGHTSRSRLACARRRVCVGQISCYDGPRPLCVLAIVNELAGTGCPESVAEVRTELSERVVRHTPLCAPTALACARASGHVRAVCRVSCLPRAQLARRFRNDKTIAFGCVGAAKQTEFLSGFGMSSSELPALVAVKGGRRPRAARMEGGLDVAPMAAFVDGLLGGGGTFKRLSDGLPALEPPYLLDKDEM
jgi:hypothetical protein